MTMIRRVSWLIAAIMVGDTLMGQEADKPGSRAGGNQSCVGAEESKGAGDRTINAVCLDHAGAAQPAGSRRFCHFRRAAGHTRYTAALKGGKPETLVAQAEWILANRVSRNIVYVTTEGDISNDGNEIAAEWLRATNALYRLDDPVRTGLPDGLPWSAVVGNHDTHSGGTILFNTFLGTNHFAGRSYYGGHYGGNNDNHYDLFSAGGLDFIVLALTWGREATPT